MEWVTVIWTMVGTASLMLALVHGFAWMRQWEAEENFWFAAMAMGTAAMAVCEYGMMRETDPEVYGQILRWFHVPVWVTFVALVGFVRVQLGGRVFLAWLAAGLRTVSLIPNFLCTPNMNYREITALKQVSFLGQQVAVPEGAPNPWMLVGQLSLAVLLWFVVDAAVGAWRAGRRQRARKMGIGLMFFVGLAMLQAVLVFWGLVRVPLVASLYFVGILGVMGSELSLDLLRAARLAEELRGKERELRASEERLNLAAEAAGAGLWSLDPTTGKFWATQRALDLFAFPSGTELTVETFLSVIHPEDRERIRETIGQALREGGPVSTEYRALLAGDRVRWFSSKGRARRNGDSGGGRLMGVTTDITERKASEDEAHRVRGELAHLARVASLSELSSSLAHELNQPLAIILSNAQAAQRLLKQEPPDLSEVEEILADIVSEDRRAGEVIKRLRAMLKRGEPNRQELNLNDVIEEVLRLARSDLLNRSVLVSCELAPGLPRLMGDRIPLEQVILNLLMNACDAVAGNRVEERQVRIATRSDEGAVYCVVSDRGCGLPADRENVFKPFFTTKADGLGIGLSICRTIITAHGGRLWAEPQRDGGASFCLSLPLKTPNE